MRTCWSLLTNTELHVQEQSASSVQWTRQDARMVQHVIAFRGDNRTRSDTRKKLDMFVY